MRFWTNEIGFSTPPPTHTHQYPTPPLSIFLLIFQGGTLLKFFFVHLWLHTKKVIICSSSLLLLAPWKGCTSRQWHFLDIFANIFNISCNWSLFVLCLDDTFFHSPSQMMHNEGKKGSYVICKQAGSRSACTSMQSDLGILCLI